MKMTKGSSHFLYSRGRFPFQTDAFRGHDVSLSTSNKQIAPAVTRRRKDCSCVASLASSQTSCDCATCLRRGLQFMQLPLRFRCRKHLLFPLEWYWTNYHSSNIFATSIRRSTCLSCRLSLKSSL